MGPKENVESSAMLGDDGWDFKKYPAFQEEYNAGRAAGARGTGNRGGGDVNVVPVAPAGTTTVAGTDATAESLLLTDTVNPVTRGEVTVERSRRRRSLPLKGGLVC